MRDDAKDALRRKFKKIRNDLPENFKEEAALAIVSPAVKLVKKSCGPGAKIAAYWPLKGEFSTLPLLCALQAAGFETVLPVVIASNQPLAFRTWRWGDDLEEGDFGVRQPKPNACERTPDFIFVPLIAFDPLGNRLGFGAGYYDLTLLNLRQNHKAIACGLAFACQQTKAISCEPHDQKLDFVLTERNIARFSSSLARLTSCRTSSP